MNLNWVFGTESRRAILYATIAT